MNRLLSSFIFFFVFAIPLSFGQLNISFDTANPTAGETVEIDVSVSNFVGIELFQFGIAWDSTVASFVGITNVTNELAQFSEANNIGTPNNAALINDGELSLSWSLNSTEPVTLPDETVLFTIVVEIVGMECDETTFEVTPPPVGGSIEVFINNLSENIGATSTGGLVSIPGVDCEGGMDGVGLIGSMETGITGSQVCVSVTTDNFTNIASIQAGIVWDPTILDFVSVEDSNLTGISLNDNEVDMGELKLLWIIGLGDDPVTLNDGDELFQICFDIVGSTGQMSDISFVDLPNFNIEVSDGDGIAVDYYTQNGKVTVIEDGTGETCDTGVGLIGDSLNTAGVANICLPITSKDFTNIASVQTGIVWDETVLSLTEVVDGAMTGISVNDLNADMGELKLLWLIGLGDDPVTVDDGTVLFELCFDAIGSEGQSSSVSFVDLPDFEIEIANGDGIAEEYCTITGFVNITDSVVTETCDIGVGLIGDSLNTGGVANICLPVTSKDFINIASVQTGIVWDETVLSLTEVVDGAMTGISVNALNADMGELKLLWLIGLGDDPVTVDDGTVLFELCFDAIGSEGQSSSVSFVDLPDFEIEIANGDGVAEEYCTITGFVNITDSVVTETCDIGVGLIGDSLNTAGVANICLPVTSKDFTNIASVQTGIVWDETVLSLTEVVDGAMTGISVNALNADMGELKLLWLIGLGDDPVTVDDGTVLFELCFDAIGSEGQSSSVSFVDLPDFEIEIANGDGVAEEYCTITGFVNITDSVVTETCDIGVGLIGDSLNTAGVANICLPVTSKDFTNIASVQTGIVWDETVLSLTEVVDGAISGISVNALNADMGELKLLWLIGLGDDPVTVDDGTVLFELCFDAIGALGQSSSVSFVDLPDFEIEIANGDGMAEEYCTITGFIEITEEMGQEDCDVGVGLLGDTLSVMTATSFCMPVTTQNFVNIASVQSGIAWDPGVLSFSGVNDVNLTGISINPDNAANGDIRLLWIIGLGNDPVSLTDGDVLFEICFDAIGSPGSMSDVSFVNLENFDVEIANGEGMAERVCLIPGKVTLEGDVSDEFSLIATDISADQGDEACVEIKVTKFDQIQSAQFTINWDDAVLTYNRVEMLNPGICDLTLNNFFPVASDKLRISWSCANGASVPDSSVFFTVCFDVIGDCNPASMSAIQIVDDPPILVEISDVNNDLIDPVIIVNGSISVNECVMPLECMLNAVDHVDCTGDSSGGIFIDFAGGSGNITCDWTYNGETCSFCNDCDLQGIPAGTYVLTATDEGGNSCTLEVEVLEPDEPINVSGESSNAVCGEGGSVNTSVSGGTGDYNYSWTPDQGNVEDLLNVGPGEYCVTVSDENNCIANMCFTVEDSNPVLSISSATTTNISCSDLGSIDISVEGGCTPITYTWRFNNNPISSDQDITQLTDAGIYTVEIIDSSDPEQQISMQYSITSSLVELSVSGEATDLSCNGEMDGTINLNVEGGCPEYIFVWDNGATTEDLSELSAGTYCVSVNDQINPSDNPVVMCFDVEQPGPVTIDLVGIQNVTNLDGNNGVIDIEPNGGVGDYSFIWSPNGSISEDQINMPPGEYCVTVTDSNNCSANGCYTISWAAVFFDNCVATPTECSGECTGSIDCDIVGGCSGVEIRINNVLVESFPILNLCADSYTIEIIDECGNTDSEVIIIPEPGDLVIDTSEVNCTAMDLNSGSIEIDIEGGVEPYTITWGGASECDGSQTCQGLGIGFYTVAVEDGNGCQALIQNIEITECSNVIPDDCYDARPIITPNSDGLNDQFIISCANLNDNLLQIFDRWGRLVNEFRNYDNTWEGTHSDGTMLDDGGYMWVIEVTLPNGDTILRTGSLTILRTNF